MFAGHFDFGIPLLGMTPALLTEADCQALIEAAEACGGWLEATVQGRQGREVRRRVRDASVSLLPEREVHALHARIWPPLRPALPAFRGRPARGLTRALRIYRYRPGQRFSLHRDQSYIDGGLHSELTLLLYLNTDFSAGLTVFPELDRSIAPRTGHALWFQHMLLHESTPPEDGTRYLLRCDVLF